MSIILHLLTSIEVLDVTFDDCVSNHRPLLVIDYSVINDPKTTSDPWPSFTKVIDSKSIQHIYRAPPKPGGGRDRTGGLVLAKHTLSQLSYTPVRH